MYSESRKIELVKTYLLLGRNLSLACKSLGIPYATANVWKPTDWWEATEQQLLVKDTIEINTKIRKALDLSSSAVLDRLENGDWIYDQKTGSMRRKPVALRDAQVVFKETLDIKNALEEKPKLEEEAQSMKQTLAQLAKNFEELAAKQKEKPVVQVTDVVFIEESKEEQ